MHFEILIEDSSSKIAIAELFPKIIGTNHSFRTHSYKGVGKIPKNLNRDIDPRKRILLEQLPRLLKGYGKAFQNLNDHTNAVIVVCDLDKKCLKDFRSELNSILDQCNPKPLTRFCIAVEESESWFLGDIEAIKKAYPKAKVSILENYEQDSICGTWEILANAVTSGGSKRLLENGWQKVGLEKSSWSENITKYMDINNNNSPSFKYFKRKVLELVN